MRESEMENNCSLDCFGRHYGLDRYLALLIDVTVLEAWSKQIVQAVSMRAI